MKYKHLILEKKEYVYLKRILNISEFTSDTATKKSLLRLTEELTTALVVDEQDMPADIIRFNSIVSIETTTRWKQEIQLVTPVEGDVSLKKISILKPMGAALIGYAADDVIEWEFPSGKQQLHIVHVKQADTYNNPQTNTLKNIL
jgi:regulator of nucleoside diphosphate kinase